MKKKAATAWWDKLGKPQYGGEMVIRANWDIVNFDPHHAPLGTISSAWLERLVSDDWTLDPEIYDYKTHYHPYQYLRGHLAESWEFTDPGTYIIHLRKGIHWQDIPPACGREFVAEDVVFHFKRAVNLYRNLISVTAADKYTVVFKWKTANPDAIMQTLHSIGNAQLIENPEAVRQWGDLNDWHHAIGTGPFILRDFVPGVSATLVKNQNYYGYDERYPQNKLPYVDGIKYLIIPDEAKAIEALCAGKIDIVDQISPVQALAVRTTHPEILQFTHPDANAESLEPRNDVAPFNDIRVRKAMQLAIDLPGIAKNHYQGTVEPYPATMTSRYMKGFGFPYEEWPQELKDEYTYNPEAAKKLLTEAGYPDGFKTNVVADTGGDIALLKLVKSYFADVGIEMEIRPVDYATFNDFVKVNHKHDQITYHPAGAPLGHCSAPLHDLTRFRTGSGFDYMMVSDPVFDSFYDKAVATDDADKIKQLLKDANRRVAEQHFSIALLQPLAYSLCQPWLKGFSGQFGAPWAHAGGPAMLSFYLARFWLDQELKKSLGH
jgi:peptide/nickel transport system substrate-binding protein